MKTEKFFERSKLKKAFEIELKRLGRIVSSNGGSTDFLSLIKKLGDAHIIAPTIAHNEMRKAYCALIESEEHPDTDTNGTFLQNMLTVLSGIPTPLHVDMPPEQEYAAAA